MKCGWFRDEIYKHGLENARDLIGGESGVCTRCLFQEEKQTGDGGGGEGGNPRTLWTMLILRVLHSNFPPEHPNFYTKRFILFLKKYFYRKKKRGKF